MDYTETGEIIGEGAFGRVVVVTDTEGHRYAKKICTYKKYIRETLSELETMQILEKDPLHPGYRYIVHLVTAMVDSMGEGVELVMDLYEGCLLDLMRDKEDSEIILPLDEITVLDVARHISLGLSYMNFCRISHCDVKPENILWRRSSSSTSGYHFVLADFGISQQITGDKVCHHIQTKEYRCVENILGEPIGLNCDMPSLGCILYEAITGDYLVNVPDTGLHIIEILERIGLEKLSKYDSDELPALKPYLEMVDSVQGDLATDDNEQYTLIQDEFVKKNFKKRNDMIDFIIKSIIPYPKQRLQAKDALFHPLLK